MNLNGNKILILFVLVLLFSSCESRYLNSKDLSTAIIPKPNNLKLNSSICNFKSIFLVDKQIATEEIRIFKNQVNKYLAKEKDIFNSEGIPLLIKLHKTKSKDREEYSLIIKSDSIIISSKS